MEYVIITCLIGICAVVSLFSFFDAARQVALDKRLCIDCLNENQQVDTLELDADRPEGEDGDATGLPDRPLTAAEELRRLRAKHEAEAPIIFAVADFIGSVMGSSHVVAWIRSIFYPAPTISFA